MGNTPATPQQMEVIGGGPEEGRVMFKGLTNDHIITTNKSEKNLLTEYRKLNRLDREKSMVDAEWILNNPKTFGLPPLASRKIDKTKNTQKLMQIAKSVKKASLRR